MVTLAVNHSMKKVLVTLLISIASNAIAQVPKPCEGKIIRYEHFTSQLVDARNIDVWLPEHYDPSKKYAVLYMHDGQMLYDSTVTWNKQEWMVDETLSSLMKQHTIQNCIVVGIWNNDKRRHAEYFPQKAIDYIAEDKRKDLLKLLNNQPLADNYLSFLVKELKPFIDSSFSVYKDREHTFIAGSSMGGLISMYAICEYPDVFYGAACLSTHWTGIFSANDIIPDALLNYMKKQLPSAKNHRIYFDYGDKTLDSLYQPYQQKVDALMRAKKYNSKNWETKYFPGEEHSERAWQQRFAIPAEFLLKQ